MSRLAAALQDLRALDTLAARDSPLARRDPRAKLLLTLLFVVAVLSFDRYQVAALLPLGLFPVLLAAQSRVPARAIARMLWLAAPFALIVGLANPLFDRAPLLAVGGVAISGGWLSLASIVLRATLCVAATVALLGGTGMPAVCAALSRLGAPAVFTTQLLFLHRYLFVLGDEAQRLRAAYALRAPQHSRLPLPAYASLAGPLLMRAFDRAQRIHRAMLARGFDGQLQVTRRWHWSYADTLFVLGWCGWFWLARRVDLPQALGRWLMGA